MKNIVPACLSVAADSDSPLIAAARAAFGALSDAQRMAAATAASRVPRPSSNATNAATVTEKMPCRAADVVARS